MNNIGKYMTQLVRQTKAIGKQLIVVIASEEKVEKVFKDLDILLDNLQLELKKVLLAMVYITITFWVGVSIIGLFHKQETLAGPLRASLPQSDVRHSWIDRFSLSSPTPTPSSTPTKKQVRVVTRINPSPSTTPTFTPVEI